MYEHIEVYGNVAVYGSMALSVHKIDYTLRCFEYICSVSSQLRRHGREPLRPLNREDTDKCTLSIKYS